MSNGKFRIIKGMSATFVFLAGDSHQSLAAIFHKLGSNSTYIVVIHHD
ncbi:hypothetical protein MADE_000001022495 [Alteromonas mediterranea DE]|uniref:Uncharacterized protein n=1 Tax=Alteromonas mediterranea (strain DSM 17117 / CIP 110805 / LMG 28347 / Deep ecotype) TaxID=1774373 RepID=T2DN17_ALTMD|nr:hypothetical protein MADE_000001022495 [Alteromonas mediterranea DE]